MTTSSKNQLSLSLPVINFSSLNLKAKTHEWDSAKAQVRKALEEYGCFEALFDGVSQELRKAVFKASVEVFDLPTETKLKTKSEPVYKGYFGQIPTTPLHEAMGIDYSDIPQCVDVFTHKLWPQGNITFSKNVQLFTEQLKELTVMMRTMIMESFGLQKYLEEHFNSTKNHLRLLKYRGLDDNTEEELGQDPHVDRNFLTILCQNDVVDGLEIEAKDGKEWIKAKPSQDTSFLVISGVSLHVLLNGRVFPPLHRVVITGKKDRYAAGLFLIPREGSIVNAPEEVVDDEHPRLYKPFDYEDYYNKEIAKKKKKKKSRSSYLVASGKTSKPLPMDESGEKEMKLEMKLLSLKEKALARGVVPGCGVVGRIIVWGYDTRLPQDVVETALRNHFSDCGMITDVCVPINYGSDAEELEDISYIYFFTGKGAVDNALLLNGTDVGGGWTVYVKPYPFRPNLKPMVWLTVEGFDTSVSKIEIKRELIKLFSSCGEVHEYDVHVFKSGSADLIVKGEDAAEKVPKLDVSSFMGQHKLVLQNVCYGHIQIHIHHGYHGYDERSGYAFPGCGEVGRIIVSGYDTTLTQEAVERALINHFSECGMITDVCVPINPESAADAEEVDYFSYIYFVGQGAVEKALDLDQTDVGGWTVYVKPYPFGPDAKHIVWLTVTGFDAWLPTENVERALIKHFSSCGEVDVICVFGDGSAALFVTGEDAAEKIPKLNGSFMEQHKLVLRDVCYWKIRTVHERINFLM